MNHHWRMRQPLQAFLDGELPAEKRARLAAHLGRCSDCAAVLKQLESRDRLLAGARLEPPVLSPEASQALLCRAMSEASARRGGPGLGWPLLAWGIATLLVVGTSGAAWWYGPPAGRVDRTEDRGTAQTRVRGPLDVTLRTIQVAAAPPAAEGNPVRSKSVAPPSKRPARSGKPTLWKKEEPPAVAPRPGLEPGERPKRARPRRYPVATLCDPDVQLSEPQAEWGDMTLDLAAADLRVNDLGTDRLSAEGLGEEHTGSRGAAFEARVARTDLLLACREVVNDPETERLVSETLSDYRGAADDLYWRLAERSDAGAWRDEPSLLVVVTSGPSPSPVMVTHAPEGTPGFARATTIQPDAAGGAMWMQATVTTEQEGSQLALVMLGAGSWQW